MTVDLGAPGVQFQRRRVVPAIGPLRTDIALFVGIAERGPLHRPVAVESFEEFSAVFGGFAPYSYLAYALKAFFENGGERAWIVRAASRDAARGAHAASADLPTVGGGDGWRISASSEGAWGGTLSVSVQPGRRRSETSAPSRFDATSAEIGSLDGFETGEHVRLLQPGGVSAIRVVSHIDADARRIHWVHPDPLQSEPTDAGVTGLDRNAPLSIDTLTYTFIVRIRGRVAEIHRDASLSAAHSRYIGTVFERRQRREEEDPTAEAISAPPLITIEPVFQGPIPPEAADDPVAERVLEGGRNGLAVMTIKDIVGDPFDVEPRGLAASAGIDEIAIVAAPDLHIRPRRAPQFAPPDPVDPCDPCSPPPAADPQTAPIGDAPRGFSDSEIAVAQTAILDHCEALRDRFAVLSTPYSAATDDAGLGPALEWRRRFDASRGALYHPWVKAPDPIGPEPLREVPPHGHVIGQMSAHDLETGVHHPPANTRLAWIQGFTVTVSEEAHGVLNAASVNALRTRAGLGARVHGARTLSSDPLWRFVNTRRLVMMIGRALDLGSRWAAFEPNGPRTWRKLSANISAFLGQIWTRGALRGATAGEAFSVRCDAANNPPDTSGVGRLNVDVAIAPVGALEYVIVRLGRIDGGLDVVEARGRAL